MIRLARKLEMNGRIFGTMQLTLEHGLEPKNMALGAIAGIALLLQKADEYNLPSDLHVDKWQNLNDTETEKILNWLWSGQTNQYTPQIIKLTQSAIKQLTNLIK